MTAADTPGPGPDFVDHDTWFAALPGVVLSAGALITDPFGKVLLVKPNYRDHWTLPGGICEHGEPPHAGCAREVAEELGLAVPVGALLAIDWSQPYGGQSRPIMHFVFDGGTLDDGAGVVLQGEELDEFRFTDPAEVSGYLAPYGVRRLAAALSGRASGAVVYQPTAAT
jgi:8-oxo-dGTP diphosphatase